MKRVLMLASVASMIDQFNIPNIALLQKMGYNVDVACNFIEGNTCSDERVQALKAKLRTMGVRCFQVDFARNITHIARNLRALRQVLQLMKTNHYAFCHCHSPIGSAVARIAGHKTGTKIIYTAHGFHFYQGAPVKNWLLYYPVEKFLSRWTDVLITINREDYNRAKKHFHAKKIYYVPGVGIDLERFHVGIPTDVEAKRAELGLKKEDIVLLSVGELSERKNHAVVLEALRMLVPTYPQIKYLICGQGEEKEHLLRLIHKYGLTEHVTLLGFRTDVSELYQAADIFVFPSKQEGLPVALMEAMACGLPVICSDIRGNRDLIDRDGAGGYLVASGKESSYRKAFIRLYTQKRNDASAWEKMGMYNRKILQKYNLRDIKKIMERIYG